MLTQTIRESKSAELTNALMEQKDFIVPQIRCITDYASAAAEVRLLLSVLYPVWRAAGYEYKYSECIQLLRSEVHQTIRTNANMIHELEKKASTRKRAATLQEENEKLHTLSVQLI